MVRDYQERHKGTQNKMVLESLPESWKSGNGWKMTWGLFQIYEATDENDLDFTIAVFRVGTHIDNEEDRNDRVGTYRGIRAAR